MAAPRAILIAGPTASGKSALALALAERLQGTVINVDSMQVYRDLRILTARPSPQDEARIPHALYGFVDGAQAYSAGRFVADAQRAIDETRATGRRPILVGGTGLYFKALLDGLSAIPAIPPDVRAYWRAERTRRGAAELHVILSQRDPVMASRLMATDAQRLVRALEVLDATGRSLAAWQAVPGRPVLRSDETTRLMLLPPRAELYRRCDDRLDRMLAAGALDEVQVLARRALDPELPVMRALGLRPLLALVAARSPRDTAITEAKSAIRRYAKRQLTWLKSNMIAWTVVKEQELKMSSRGLFRLID